MNDPQLNVLAAFPYVKKQLLDMLMRETHIRFLLDSGAFSAWRTGKEIILDEYCDFIETHSERIYKYFNLDVVGNAEASFRNYEIMRKRGFEPMPVFTRGAQLEELDRYYETADVVAIGGLVGTPKAMGFVKGIMRHIGKRKTHWLGFVRHTFINHYKPCMCDASSWSHASRNGDLKVYLGGGKIKSYRRKHFIDKPSETILELLRSYDLSSKELASEDFWKSGARLNKAAARMWVRRSIETEAMIGTKLFLACGSHGDVQLLLDGYEKERANVDSSSLPRH